MTFGEDAFHVRIGTAHAMVGLRDLTLGVLRPDDWTGIAQALRHHSRRPARLLEALGVS
ncbi:hypothetical protein ACFYY3_06215 [Streptomyces sp. NPDC001812]|uniref:Uncharacterized protein n=1 Tax=Streptomyces cathayae TaxID=3031124 RepID=A0ABY8JWQ4_9ACTN|nr:hypothetical protein [Streptomyces sp. HUAS 5]WGD40216.1 hypothetical protein PYS65_08795 [Streptomyces sp. HUAS 5]